jgi:hypothetical protein
MHENFGGNIEDMPIPTLARTGRSLKNLKGKPGPGRPRLTAAQKAERNEGREIARKLVNDPQYRKRLRDGYARGRSRRAPRLRRRLHVTDTCTNKSPSCCSSSEEVKR